LQLFDPYTSLDVLSSSEWTQKKLAFDPSIPGGPVEPRSKSPPPSTSNYPHAKQSVHLNIAPFLANAGLRGMVSNVSFVPGVGMRAKRRTENFEELTKEWESKFESLELV
jgi:hypothetical protein